MVNKKNKNSKDFFFLVGFSCVYVILHVTLTLFFSLFPPARFLAFGDLLNTRQSVVSLVVGAFVFDCELRVSASWCVAVMVVVCVVSCLSFSDCVYL